MHHCKVTCTPKEERKKEVSVAGWVGRDESNLTAVAGGAIPAHGGVLERFPTTAKHGSGQGVAHERPDLFCQDLVGLCISSPHSPSSTQQPQLSGTTQNPSRDIMFYKWHEPRHGMVGSIVQLSQQNSTMDAESKLWPWHPKTTQRRTETRPKKKNSHINKTGDLHHCSHHPPPTKTRPFSPRAR